MQQVNKIFLFCWSVLFSLTLQAVPATPYPAVKTQPDGSTITVYLKGDEFFSYELTEDGYLIRKDKSGYYHFANVTNQSEIVTTNTRVRPIDQRTEKEKSFIQSLTKYPDFSIIQQKKKAARISAGGAGARPEKIFPNSGSPASIVILVNFQDVSFVTPNPQTAFTNLLNQEGYAENGATGSARDYFNVASNGASTPEFIVVGPYTLPNNRAYYGANDEEGDDVKPREMVIDACLAASEDGVDFSSFDTDNDGVVDNVFIYYAGHNEAEHGPEESIWPHRWALNADMTLNEKKIDGYACTSELRGATGSTMCGIGTFCHEFGHVYGLVDYYATNNADHHTLSRWNIMDAGAYLNLGRTPPTYSAYDRFYLGWLTPTILNSPQEVTLEDIKTSNEAYIITQNGTHNLDGANPSPLEFFTIENRQKTGWDSFLPESGMLVTRIYYNANTWRNNTPNNIATAMGVDIIEADGIGSTNSLAGDPFPGTYNITSFYPELRNGTNINRPITGIKEIDNTIHFTFMNPPVIHSNHNELSPFRVIFGENLATQEIIVSGEKLVGNVQVDLNYNTHFELKRKDDNSNSWYQSVELIPVEQVLDSTTILIRYNPTTTSFDTEHIDYLNIRTEDVKTITTALSGLSSKPVLVIPPVAYDAADISLNGFMARWNKVKDASGYYLTVYNVMDGASAHRQGFDSIILIDNKLTPPIEWDIEANTINYTTNYAGISAPSIQFGKTGDYIQTETYKYPVLKLSFFIRSIGENNGTISIEGRKDSVWTVIDNFAVTSDLNTTQEYEFTLADNYTQFKLTYQKGIAYTSIDDVEATLSQKIEFSTLNKWVTENSFYVDFLVPGRTYFYSIKASDKTLNSDNSIKYENITASSNVIQVELIQDDIVQYASKANQYSVYKDNSGNIILNKIDAAVDSEPDSSTTIFVYNTTGMLIKTIESSEKTIALSGLTPGQIYFVKIGVDIIKILL